MYYGDIKQDSDGNIIGVGDYKVSSLSQRTRSYIMGMNAVYTNLRENIENDWEDDGYDGVIGQIESEERRKGMEKAVELIKDQIIDNIISFGDSEDEE